MSHLRPAQARLFGQVVGDGPDLADQAAGAGDPRPLLPAGHHGAGDVGDRRPHPAPAHVDPHHPAGLGIELVEERARATAAVGATHLAHEPSLEQAAQRQGNGGLGEAAFPRHVRPRHRSLPLDAVQDRALVDRLEQRGRPGGGRWGAGQA